MDEIIKNLKDNNIILYELDNDCISFINLLDEDFLNNFIIKLNSYYNSKSIKATCSFFIKRFLFIPTLYNLFTYENYYLDFKIDDLYLKIDYKNIIFYIKDFKLTKSENHIDDLKLITINLFTQIINPLINSLHKISNLDKTIFYNHIAYILDYIYTTNITEQKSIDFEVLKHQLNGNDFNLTFNPINIKINEIYIKELKKKIKIRKSCCLKYLINNEERCYTCPNLKEYDRIRIYKSIYNLK